MDVFPKYMCVHHVRAVSTESEKGIGASGTRASSGCELPCRCWEPNPGPMEEQVLLSHLSRPLEAIFMKIYAYGEICPCMVKELRLVLLKGLKR